MSDPRPGDQTTAAVQEPLGVLVVDDHQVIADTLCLRLATVPWLGPVHAAYSLASARLAVASRRPDVVLLDWSLGRENGLELIPFLVRLEPPAAVVVLSGRWTTDQVLTALEAGARGWVLKTARADQLVQRVADAHAGRTFLPDEAIGAVLDQLLVESGRRRQTPSFLDHLTARESQVLRCLVEGLGREEIAQRLFISPHTVRTHIQNLLRASGLHSTLALVSAARDIGLRTSPADAPVR